MRQLALREQECGFVRRLKPTEFTSMGSSIFLAVGYFDIPLLHRWMSAGDGSSAGVKSVDLCVV